ncbi:MAG: hypothetical protein GY756_27470 [bacterium]|nr:hypothetical protein [bacterium]
MPEHWITVSEAIVKTGKSEITIRRYIAEHNKNINIIKKQHGKIFINTKFLYRKHKPVNNTSIDKLEEEVKQTKEAMHLAYESKLIIEKDNQIEQLLNRKRFLPLWITLGFTVLVLFLIIGGALYRNDLINQHKEEIITLNNGFKKIITGKNEIITEKNKTILYIKNSDKQLINTLTNQNKLLKEENRKLKN